MVVQNVSAASTGLTDISFTLPSDDGQRAMSALQAAAGAVGFDSLLYDDQIGKISLIGAGMRTNPGVTATFFRRCPTAGVNIELISTSEIRISVVTRRRRERGGRPPRTTRSGSTATASRPSCTEGPADDPGAPSLAVVGATGAVGTVMLDLLSTRDDVWGEIRLIASPRSAGRQADRPGRGGRGRRAGRGGLRRRRRRHVRRARRGLRAVGAGRRGPRRGRRGQLRRVPDGPGRAAGRARGQPGARGARRPRGIIANPNCTTLSMIVAMGALHAEFGLSELIVSSYQAVSGAGQAGIDTLRAQIAQVAGTELGSAPGDVRAGGRRHRAVPGADGAQRGAVRGLAQGGRLVLGGAEGTQRVPQDPRPAGPAGHRDLCARARHHHPLADRARAVRERGHGGGGARDPGRCAGCGACDNPAEGEFPTPADVVGTDPTWVGRVRRSLDDPKALELFVCGDNLRKGAALNTAQIGEVIAAELGSRPLSWSGRVGPGPELTARGPHQARTGRRRIPSCSARQFSTCSAPNGEGPPAL